MTAPGGVSIDIAGLNHSYRSPAGGTVDVLRSVSLSMRAGGYLALTGSSGAGKSTLLAVLGGLERPQSGAVRVGTVDLRTLGRDGLAAYRRRTVGFVFQHFGLLETLTAVENVELALTLAGLRRAERRRAASAVLDELGLGARLHHRTLALSGGERQRVAIARAMANQPQLILADEPTGNLDEESAANVIELLEDASSRRGCTLVVVTHSRVLAARATQRLHLVEGRPAP